MFDQENSIGTLDNLRFKKIFYKNTGYVCHYCYSGLTISETFN